MDKYLDYLVRFVFWVVKVIISGIIVGLLVGGVLYILNHMFLSGSLTYWPTARAMFYVSVVVDIVWEMCKFGTREISYF